MHLRDSFNTKLTEMIYYGFWFAPEFEALRALIEETQQVVSGDVRIKLYKGNCIVTGRQSDNSLYAPEFATFEADDVYDQRDAEGFIKLNALRLRIRAMMSNRR
jgi:argininosuccinate synthase